MEKPQIAVELYGPLDHAAASHQSFTTWNAALDFVRSWTREQTNELLRVYVPPSLATSEQLNELRQAVGLVAQY